MLTNYNQSNNLIKQPFFNKSAMNGAVLTWYVQPFRMSTISSTIFKITVKILCGLLLCWLVTVSSWASTPVCWFFISVGKTRQFFTKCSVLCRGGTWKCTDNVINDQQTVQVRIGLIKANHLVTFYIARVVQSFITTYVALTNDNILSLLYRIYTLVIAHSPKAYHNMYLPWLTAWVSVVTMQCFCSRPWRWTPFYRLTSNTLSSIV